MVVDSQARGGKQFHPLDEHLAHGLLPELQKDLCVYLAEVGRRYQGQQILQIEQERLSLLAGAACGQDGQRDFVDLLPGEEVCSRCDHHSQFLTDELLHGERADLAFDRLEHHRDDLDSLRLVFCGQAELALSLVVGPMQAPIRHD